MFDESIKSQEKIGRVKKMFEELIKHLICGDFRSCLVKI